MCGGGEPTEKGQGRGGGVLSPGKGLKLPVPRSRNVARRRLGSTRGSPRSSSPVSCRPAERSWHVFLLVSYLLGLLPPPRPRAPVRPKYRRRNPSCPTTCAAKSPSDDIRGPTRYHAGQALVFFPAKKDAEVKNRSGLLRAHTAHAITGGCREPFAEIGSMWSPPSP